MKMPISIPTDRQNRANGFTLTEMLVVIFLLGLASAAVVLTLPGDQNAVRNDAERMAVRIAAARDEAVMQARPLAFWVRASGYGFEQRRDGEWQPHPAKPFQPKQFGDGTRLATNGAARIVFDTTGLPSSQAEIELIRKDGRTRISIAASGEVRVAP